MLQLNSTNFRKTKALKYTAVDLLTSSHVNARRLALPQQQTKNARSFDKTVLCHLLYHSEQYQCERRKLTVK